MDLVETNEGATHAMLAEIITLKDYMAMTALGGLLGGIWSKHGGDAGDKSTLASAAYDVAEAMLAERAKREQTT